MDLKKQSLIKTLENELLAVPKFSMFGDDNHEQINAGIDFLKNIKTLDDIVEEFEDDNMEVIGFIDSITEYLSGDVELEDIIWNEESIVKQIDLVPTVDVSPPTLELGYLDVVYKSDAVKVGNDAQSVAHLFTPTAPMDATESTKKAIIDVEYDAVSDAVNDAPKYKIKVCKKLCGDCPFSKNSFKGFLADYTIQDFMDYQNNDVLFPCHKVMTDGDKSVEEVQEMFKSGELYLCRGYVENFIRSCKMPRNNQFLKDAVEQVRKEGLNDNSMSMYEFQKHHNADY